MVDHGNHQTAVGLHRDAEMDRPMPANHQLVVVETGVHVGMGSHRNDHRSHQEGQQ